MGKKKKGRDVKQNKTKKFKKKVRRKKKEKRFKEIHAKTKGKTYCNHGK